MFEVVAKLPHSRHYNLMLDNFTRHVLQRHCRLKSYYETVGRKHIVDVFLVNRNHPNGLEIHVLRANRVIEIYNKRTSSLITVIYARTAQIKRYYEYRGKPPIDLFDSYVTGLNQL